MKPARILIVDDKQENVYFVRALLQGHGYEVVSAVHGAEALEIARRSPPDLVIADILMPVMDGFVLCSEWMKDERLQRVPFIFYTATYTDDRDREFALSLGAARFIVKPEEPDSLMAMIRETLQQAATATDGRIQPAAVSEGEAVYLKQYNQTLVRKLEAKMLDLEQSNRRLEQDIVARRAAEDALRESEIRFRELFNNMTSGVAVYEAKDGGADFVFEDINEAGLGIAGMRKEDMVGRAVTAVFPGIRKMGLMDVLQRVWRTGMAECYPATQYTDARFSHWYENRVYKLPSGEIVAVYDNVTDRKRAELASQESEQRYRQFIEQAPDAIYTLSAEGVITSLNPAFEKHSGWSREEWIGKHLAGIVHPEDLAVAVKSFEATLRGEPTAPLEMRIRMKNEQWKTFEISSGPFMEHGEIAGEFGIARDMNERKKAEAVIGAQLTELRRWHDATIGREERIAELKREVNDLLKQAGAKARYGGGG